MKKKKIAIPPDVLDMLYSTDDMRILNTISSLEKELNSKRNENVMIGYLNNIGIFLEDTYLQNSKADEIYFKLAEIVRKTACSN